MKFLLAAIVLALASVACKSGEADRVVGVVLKCTGGGVTRLIELSGDECAAKYEDGRFQSVNRRIVITVKPANGAAYNAELPPDATVTVGDRWPR